MIHTVINVILLTYNAWEAIFACIGIIGTALGLKAIWSNNQSKNQISLIAKILLSLFYILHITAIFFAAGIFGETFLGATIATLLVSMTSLINDSYDYVQERYQNYKLNQKIKKLQYQLFNNNINFEQNSFFFEDVMDLQDEIECLYVQQEELLLFLSQFENQNENCSKNINTIKNIAAALKERGDSIIDENEVIRNFNTISSRLKLTEYQIIKKTNKEIRAINRQKNALLNNNQTSNKFKTRQSIQGKSICKQISSLEEKIKKLAIINQHFYKIKKARETKADIQQQLQSLNQKYLMPPFDEYSTTEIIALKALEKDYLQDRLKLLNHYICEKTKIGIIRKNNITAMNISLIGYDKIATLGESPDKTTFTTNLQNQITQINHILRIKERQLVEKERYLQLIAINPNEQLPQDLTKILNKARRLIKYQNKLALSKLEKGQKLLAVRYSLLSAILAIIMCCSSIWIISDVFNNLMRFIGVIAGVTSIRSFFKLRNTQIEIKSNKSKQLENLIENCKNRAKDIKIPQEQIGVKIKLFSIIEEMEKDLAAKKKRAQQRSGSPIERTKRYLPQFRMQSNNPQNLPTETQKKSKNLLSSSKMKNCRVA